MRTAELLAILAAASLVALTMHTASAAGLTAEGADDATLLAPLYDKGIVEPLVTAQRQRSLLQTASPPPPGYCSNSHIKPVFTAKVAVLLFGSRRRVDSGEYVSLIAGPLNKRFRRYNRRYRRNLGYTVRQLTTGSVKRNQQKWFYYEVQFVIGNCGLYKFPLITQLRGEIQPSAPFVKRIRLQDYPFRTFP